MLVKSEQTALKHVRVFAQTPRRLNQRILLDIATNLFVSEA